MSLSLANLLGKDTIQVELIPEKKGLFLKHVEYQVTSEVGAHETCVNNMFTHINVYTLARNLLFFKNILQA